MEDWEERISIDNEVMGGKPVIKGTRVPVQIVLGSLAGGATMNDICEDYGIDSVDVLAALAYATEIVAQEVVHALPHR